MSWELRLFSQWRLDSKIFQCSTFKWEISNRTPSVDWYFTHIIHFSIDICVCIVLVLSTACPCSRPCECPCPHPCSSHVNMTRSVYFILCIAILTLHLFYLFILAVAMVLWDKQVGIFYILFLESYLYFILFISFDCIDSTLRLYIGVRIYLCEDIP